MTVEPSAGANYTQLVDESVSQANGHAFITQYAQLTGQLAGYTSSVDLGQLRDRHAYVTRLYTRISPQQMTLDPIFVQQSGLPTVSNYYDLSDHPLPTTCDPFNRFLATIDVPLLLLFGIPCCLLIVAVGLSTGIFLLLRRGKRQKM